MESPEDQLKSQKATRQLVIHSALMFTLPFVLYYFVTRLIMYDEEQSTRQKYGLLFAVGSAICIKIHFVWVAWNDPDNFEEPIDGNTKSKELEMEESKKTK